MINVVQSDIGAEFVIGYEVEIRRYGKRIIFGIDTLLILLIQSETCWTVLRRVCEDLKSRWLSPTKVA